MHSPESAFLRTAGNVDLSRIEFHAMIMEFLGTESPGEESTEIFLPIEFDKEWAVQTGLMKNHGFSLRT
jgi:hypothetical protein